MCPDFTHQTHVCSYKTVGWVSTLDMLERLMEQQAPIAAVLMDGRVRHLMPEDEEWSIIEVLVNIPFQQATEAMGAAKVPNTEHSQATSL